jgi:hypothetical protein
MAMVGYGIPNILLELALPYLSTPYWWVPLKRPYGSYRGGSLGTPRHMPLKEGNLLP